MSNETNKQDNQQTSGLRELWKRHFIKGDASAPEQPDHWFENAIEFVFRTLMTVGRMIYPLVLIFTAAVAFIPHQDSIMWFGSAAWSDLLALIVTVVINGAHYQIKKRSQSASGRSFDLIAILVLKTTIVLAGLTYSFFQNPWSATPAPFAMPAIEAMLLNPIFLGLAALIIIDSVKPAFLRDRVVNDDENQPTRNDKTS